MKHIMICLLLILFTSGCEKVINEYPESLTLELQNQTSLIRKDTPSSLNIKILKVLQPEFNENAFVILDEENKEIPSQADDLDRDGMADQIILITDFLPDENKQATVRFSKTGEKAKEYPKRTQAELSIKKGGKWIERKYEGGEFENISYLRVPPQLTDHSYYIRYEGPGWESDKVGYRFYLDWRNAIDIFGKKVPDMVLQNVGLDDYNSYHEMADWGMDIFKVGSSLGIGSLGMWIDKKVNMVSQTDSVICEIVANGPVRSQIRTKYFGWKPDNRSYHLTSNLSITAGSRLTKHEIEITGDPSNLCTGLAKYDNCELINMDEQLESEWQYLGLYGKQSLAGDLLGIAVFFRTSDLEELSEDKLNHVVVLSPTEGRLDYYFAAAWEQEPDGIKDIQKFRKYLDKTVYDLNNPIKVIYE
jgi:hypothetical protein